MDLELGLGDLSDLQGIINELEISPTGLKKAEDSIHVSGDAGVMALGVRNDAGTVLAEDGDYIPLSMDSTGRLRVVTTAAAVSTATNTFATVTVASVTVLAANTSRRFVEIVNDSDETIFLSLSGTAVVGSGIRINSAGGSFFIDSNNLYTGIITGIHAGSGSKNLTVVEG